MLASAVTGAARPMQRSISAPTIADLLVARPAGDGFRVVDAFSRIIRLGEGVSRPAASARRRSTARSQRSRSAATRCGTRASTRARLIATEACRAAQNGDGISARASPKNWASSWKSIDRETEACLAATGCTPLIDPQAEGVDPVRHRRRLVGTCAARLAPQETSGGPPLPQIRGWISLPHGVVTLAERYGGITVTRESYEAMVRRGRRT